MRRLTLALLALSACDSAPAAWPAWPESDDDARALVEDRARRELPEEPPLTADRIVAALDRAAARGTLRAGWRSIGEALRDHRAVLVGVHHDAAEHVRVFARLFGPSGTADDRLWAIELFDAGGRWLGVPAAEQAGDDDALAALRERGSNDAVRALRERLALGAYTAWKYDYLEDVVDLAIVARGSGRALVGCDVPAELAARLDPLAEPLRLRVREIHCALALEDAVRDRPSARLALLWGDAHLAPEGLARFLPDTPARVHLVGGRASDAGVEPALAERLALTDPVLVPMGARRFVLLVPDARSRARGDRSRVPLEAPEPRSQVTASSTAPSELRVGAVRLDLADDDRSVGVPPGVHAFVLRSGRSRIAGALAIDPGGSAELFADPSARRVDVRLASPSRAPPGSLP